MREEKAQQTSEASGGPPSGRIRLSELQNNPGGRGLKCRKCGGRFFVVYVRPMLSGIRRRKECRNCGWRITTTEHGG